ncbi:MAG TPA: sialidase family protein, partial [Ktedonobacterales bacterium]
MANEHDQFDPIEPLPQEFEALQRRLLRDGARWRAGLPSTERLEQQLDALARQEQISQRVLSASVQRRSGWRLVKGLEGESSMFHGRIRTFMAVIAIAAVVALFAFLFHGFAVAHTTTGSTPKSTMVPTPHGPGSTQQSQDNTWAAPQIAPSNPHVVYQLAQASASARLTLKRSDDGGKTWKTFAVPAGSSADNFTPGIVVNPLNAQDVYLTVNGTRSGNGCQLTTIYSGQSSLSGGQNICDVQYLSRDGGAHWSVLQLPLPDALGDTSGFGWPSPLTSNSLSVFHAQGNRLYSVLGPYTENGAVLAATAARLVTSTDGGLTWQLIDANVAGGTGICDYAPDPASATLFAITSEGCSSPGISPLTLWRSDDAGAHWTQVGQLPNNTDLGMMVVSRSAGQQPLLYIDMAQMTGSGAYAADFSGPQAGGGCIDFSPSNLQVSADGGKTWQSAPTNGFPDAKGNPGKPLGVLSDGSLLFVVQSQSSGDAFYTWKLGDASWQKVGPTLQAVRYAFVSTSTADGKQTLYAVTDHNFKFAIQ